MSPYRVPPQKPRSAPAKHPRSRGWSIINGQAIRDALVPVLILGLAAWMVIAMLRVWGVV